jgi:hypothetical protein
MVGCDVVEACHVVRALLVRCFQKFRRVRIKGLEMISPGRKFEGLHHFMGEGLLKFLSFKMKVYPRNYLSYIISIFQHENAYCEFLPHPFMYK